MSSSVTLWEETAPVKLPTNTVPARIHGIRLDFKMHRVVFQGWLHRLASRSKPPTYPTQEHPKPISACSKGSWGLSVLLRVRGIFTTTTISPGRWLRQCSSRYAIHAGRNLPDKEFRYLRTVIVTAAVYRGFGCELRPKTNPLP